MRILFWTETYLPDISGVAVWGGQVLPALRERGHEIVVVTSHAEHPLPDRASLEGIPVHRFRFQSALQARDITAIKAAAGAVAEFKRAFAPDVVHINTNLPSLFFHHVTRDVAPCASAVTMHMLLDWTRASDPLWHATLTHADRVTAVSDAILRMQLESVPSIASRSRVIRNALRASPEPPSPVPVDPPHLVFVGRVSHEKGVDLALDALEMLIARFPDVRLTVAGDGPEKERLAGRVAASTLRDAVTFRGWVAPADIPALIGTATAVLVPSRWEEPFGLVALEAAMGGRPVIAARAGGLPEIVVHGETGLLFEKEDAAGLAAAVLRLLSDRGEAVRLGAAARVRAAREFDFDRMVDAYDALYRELA